VPALHHTRGHDQEVRRQLELRHDRSPPPLALFSLRRIAITATTASAGAAATANVGPTVGVDAVGTSVGGVVVVVVVVVIAGELVVTIAAPPEKRVRDGCSGAVGLDVGRRVEEAEVGIASLGHAPTGEFRRRRRRNRPLFLGFPFLSQQLSRQARGRLVLVLVLVLLLLLLFLFFWLLVFLSLLLLLLLLFSFGLLQWCWR
jgi:hypothetical protein